MSRSVLINTTPSNTVLFANQTGTAASALTLSALTTGAAGVKIFYLGGASTLANTISSVMADSTGALTIGKTGTGTWVLSGNNTFTGGFLVSGGTIQYANATTTALSGALTFTADTSNSTGWTGWQAAGGTFQYNAAGSLTVGALTPTAGAGNVVVSTGTALTFASLGTRTTGATLNFTPGSGAIKFTAAVTGTNTIIGGFATINGTEPRNAIGTKSLNGS